MHQSLKNVGKCICPKLDPFFSELFRNPSVTADSLHESMFQKLCNILFLSLKQPFPQGDDIDFVLTMRITELFSVFLYVTYPTRIHIMPTYNFTWCTLKLNSPNNLTCSYIKPKLSDFWLDLH